MKILSILICYSILLNFGYTSAQETPLTESISQTELDTLVYNYASGNGKKRLSSAELKAILLSNKNLKGWLQYYANKSSEFYNSKEYDSSLFYSNKSFAFYDELKDKRELDKHLLIRCYTQKAATEYLNQNYEVSLNYHQKAYKLTNLFEFKWKGYILAGMAQNHKSMGNRDLALKVFLELEKDSIYNSIDRAATVLRINIGSFYLESSNNTKAREYFKSALDRSLSSENYKVSLPNAYGLIGDTYENISVDSTIYYYSKSISVYNKLELKGAYQGIEDDILYREAFNLIYSKDFENGISKLNTIIENTLNLKIITNNDLSLIRKVFKLLRQVYENNKVLQTKVYSDMSQSIMQIFDKSLKDQLVSEVNNLEIKYQSKQKDESIFSLRNSQAAQELISRQRGQINSILGLLLLLVFCFSFLIYRQLKNNKEYKIVSLEQRLLRSQLNPHFLFNALNSLRYLVNNNDKNTNTYILKLGSLLRSILENSRQELISLNEEIKTLSDYLELQSYFSTKFNFSFSIDVSGIDLDAILIPPMLIQPFVENAIEHGVKTNKAGVVIVKFHIVKNQLICIVEDNGGDNSVINDQITKIFKHKSMSGSILQDRLDLYSKRFKIKSYYKIEDLSITGGKGTEVTLYLPLIIDE